MNVMDKMKQELVDLNVRFVAMEQRRDLEALDFFNAYLAEHLVLRRADGSVVGKYGQSGFMRSLTVPSRFLQLDCEAIAVELIGVRALVTLIVVGRARADGLEHRYRDIRMFSRALNSWLLELWYNDEIATEQS